MEQKTQFKRLRNYIYDDHPLFVIPNYQRGYKWSVKPKDKDSSLEHLLLDLVEEFVCNPNNDYFLQGVTVTERVINGRKNVVLIDGQQRTTSIYLILWYLSNYNLQKTVEHDSFDLSYDVRECSQLLLSELKEIPSETIDNLKEGLCSAPSLSSFSEKIMKDMNQDVYYFIEATRQIHNILKDIDKDNFQKFLLDKVSLLYIVVSEDKAVKTFTMMNGNKATMYQEELIKAEMLHAVSLSKNRVYGESDDLAFKQLLRLNVEEYNRLQGGKGQIFDFSIWKNKSLEHIYPKSRVYHVALDKDKNPIYADGQLRYEKGDGSVITESDLDILKKENPNPMLDRQLFNGNGSEHCIGNLVLLYGRDNSKFGAKSFKEKKALYFNPNAESEGLNFKSRSLLHSMYAFAKSTWGVSEIQQQKEAFIEDFKKTYNLN